MVPIFLNYSYQYKMQQIDKSSKEGCNMPSKMERRKKIHLFILSTDDTAGYDGKGMMECLCCKVVFFLFVFC